MPTVKLYGPEFSYYLRAMRLLCRFKGLHHEVTNAPFGKAIPFFSEEHARLHPFRKLPVLIEDSIVVPETLAIAHYIEDKPGPSFIPGDAHERAKVLSFAGIISLYVHQALMKGMVLEFAFPKGKDGEVRYETVTENMPGARKTLSFLTEIVGDKEFFTLDRFTLCDAYLIPMLDYMDRLPDPYNISREFPGLLNYINYHRRQEYTEGVLRDVNMGQSNLRS